MDILLIMVLHIVVIIYAREGDKLRELEKILFLHKMEEYPEFATEIGSENYNHLGESYNLEVFERRKIAMEGLLKDIYRINTTLLTRTEFLDLKILREHLQTYIDGYRWRLYGNLNPLNNFEGVIKKPKWLYIDDKMEDYKYTGRLRQLPNQIDDMIILMKLAVELNRTNHMSSMNKSLEKIELESYFLVPLAMKVLRKKLTKRNRYFLAYLPKISAAFNRLKSFLEREYIPACRKSEGLYSLQDGLEYYKACLKFHINTDKTPEQIHNIGLQEIQKIKYKMIRVMRRIGFDGNLKQFFKYIKRLPQFYTQSKNDLVQRYERLMHDQIDPNLWKLFNFFPKDPVRVIPVESPMLSTWGAYQDNKFFVSVQDVENRSTITMLPLTLHEANPGHHFQDSYVRRLEIPLYRKYLLYGRRYAVPSTFPTYSAYAEGWALYAEFLGEEMGLYKDPFNLFGRYLSEMLRARRLVVDTGIHAFGWSRERSIRFLSMYTDLSYNEAFSEVDRYIIWPGHACSYKIGELKIKALRRKAQEALGALFDIREFHDQILKVGPVSMGILEDVINDWIGMKTSTATNSVCLQEMTHVCCLVTFFICGMFQNL